MIIQYTVTPDAPALAGTDPSRVNTDQIIDVYASGDVLSEFHPPEHVENIVTAEVADNSTNEITVKGDGIRRASIVIEYADDARFPEWQEFHLSTRKRQFFTINVDNANIRHQSGTYTCQRTSTSGIKYYNHCIGITYSFDIEIFNV